MIYFSQSDTPALVAVHSVEKGGQQLQVSLACLFQRGTPVDEQDMGDQGPRFSTALCSGRASTS